MPSAHRQDPPRRTLERLALLAPGVLAGCHYAVLLFFLNPDLEYSPASVLRSLIVFGLALGLASALALRLLLRPGIRSHARYLPWALTTALMFVAAAQWFHASAFSFYLPPGIDNRLIKSAVLMSVLGLVTFYIALLHTVSGRPYLRKSRVALIVVSVLSVAIAVERRAAFPGFSERKGVGALFPGTPETRLIVVALEGASLDAILPLAEQGQLPFLATLLQQGAHGGMSTVPPVRRLPSWFTVATGAHPFRHGVASAYSLTAPFISPQATLRLWPWGSGLHRWGVVLGIRHELAAPRQGSPKLWEILQGLGVVTAIVGWPADGGHLTNQSLALTDSLFVDSRIPDGAPAQTGLARAALELRPSIESVDPSLFEPLGDNVADGIRAALVEDLWRESAARDLLASRADIGALFLALPGLLEVSRSYFGGYAAAQFDGNSDDEPQAAAQALSGYYAFVDESLQRIWTATEAPKLMVIASAHGVRQPSGAKKLWSTITGGSAIGGRVDRKSDGVVMLLGEHLRSGSFLGRSAPIDVAPTILYGLGLPIARDIDGSVLSNAFGTGYLTENPVTFVPSYDAIVPRDDLPMLQVPRAEP
ncbi:MAG: alkaline phosphatase family protein [Acidobacteriota bacterium]|nr:alkaline phosphatase family protein [Acidobacteriota bacterium]